ncbi:uncharacterized protein [Parasteatoda tepidariorum]|uniref:uncharacterized protein isoform X2 n=1 Tax=Parasteatoda tepidariorum TaxID=114398 RepID=UPI001C71F699|nr:uncharacterized protein LOC107446928 isoform X2 [Parasteatoda tepidariorum]
MVKSKIPLPSKRPAQSSIPLPTKCLGTQSKKLPQNSKEVLVSKKPDSVKQVQSISSKVRKEKENIVQRLPSSKSYDSKKVLTKEPSFNGKKVAVAKSTLTTENKVIKQAKPVPVRPTKILVSKPRPVTKDENQPKRFSSYTSQNGKLGVRSMNEQKTKSVIQSKPVPVRPSKILVSKPRPVNKNKNQPERFSSYTSQNGNSAVRSMNEQRTRTKSVIQSKVVNEAKNSNTISTNSMKENMNRNLLGIARKENVAVITPMKQINLAAKSGVDDSEFQKSGFFKSLILNERELSPGIINYCSKAKFTPSKVNLLQLQPKASPRFLTADEFVEEVKRTSSKYYRLNGRLVLRSPEMTPEKIFQGIAKNIDSVKENLNIRQVDEVRRLSEFRRQNSLNVDGLMANRRWTCNVPSKPSIASMNITEIAAEIRRVSEIRRESGVQIYKKAPFSEYQNSVEKLNPRQRALQELEFLTTKKKDKTKKKVTFLIPSGSPDLTPELSKPEAKLSDISEGSSNNCTPELDFGNGRVTTNSQKVDSAENVEDTSVSTTPELNLTTYKLEFSVAKDHNKTVPFDVSHKNDASTNNKSSINQAVSLEIDVSKKNSEQFSQNFSYNLTNLKPDFISSKFSSLKISENNVCTLQDIPGGNPASFENYLTNPNSYSEFSNVKSTDCLFQSVQNLAVPTNYQPANETEKFCVKTEKKIFTPHPVCLHSKSNIPPSVSPTFLSSGKFTTLNSVAPIYTPYVLKTLSQSPEVNLSHVRQKLDFNENPNQFMERRKSQIILQTIPTIQKMNDFLCDQECIILSSQSSEKEIFCRNLMNPVASTLTNGDEMHFMPINSP